MAKKKPAIPPQEAEGTAGPWFPMLSQNPERESTAPSEVADEEPSLDLFLRGLRNSQIPGENGPAASEGDSPIRPTRKVFDCPDAMTILATDLYTGLWHVWETRCRRWSCSRCGPFKTWQLCMDIDRAKPTRLITLTTAHHGERTTREVFDASRRKISELAKRLRRDGHGFEYCRVLEQHKSGYPHYHLVVRSGYIDQQKISRYWSDLTDAFIVDIRKINPHRKVARYIAKYLTKQMPPDFTQRRVTASRNFFTHREKPEREEMDLERFERHRGTAALVLRDQFDDVDLEPISPTHWILVSASRKDERRMEFRRDLGFERKVRKPGRRTPVARAAVLRLFDDSNEWDRRCG